MPTPRKGRVLLFAYYYPPLGGAGSNRALSFARELPKLGWDVVVVTPREGVYGRDESLDGESLPGVTVVRTGTFELPVLFRRFRRKIGGKSAGTSGGEYVDDAPLGSIGGPLRAVARRLLYFPDSCRGWVRHARKAALAVHRREPVDVVLSSSPPVSAHVAAGGFAKETGVPWIPDWRDLWAADSRSGGLLGDRAVAFERELMAGAAGLTGATAGVARMMSGLLGDPARAVTVRNGYDPADFASPPPPVSRGAILYTGTLYGKSEQDPEELFLAVREARDSGRAPAEFRLRFLGKADRYSVDLVASLGLQDRVAFEGFRDHAECIREMRSASMLLLLGSLRTSDAGLASVPAKTYEYLAAGRPILALGIEGSELHSVLSGVPGVLFLGYRDRGAIREAILSHLAGAGLASGPPAARAEPYTRAAAIRGLAGLVESILAAAKR